jgi:hypothetical protein
VPIKWGEGLPADDPIFSRGLISVFANAPLEASDDPPKADVTPEDDVEEDG